MIYSLHYDRYICISKSTQKQLLSIGIEKNKTYVIYPGVDYELFNPKKYSREKIRKKLGLEKNFIYMFYGRPGISKGFEYLLKAVQAISEKILNSKLLAIVSHDKAYQKRYDSMKKLIKELRIEDKILLLDPVPYDELPNYIKSADCVVVPSLAEGFGYTTAEACAMERPVVASNVASLPEVVSGRYVLVEPRNPKAIAEGVELTYNKKIKKHKEKKFLWRNNIDAHIRLYNSLL
jgi:glycosyltransferase involved in cell wall biosynthesis